MISSVTGVVQALRQQTCVVDVNGIGYLVNITPEHQRSLSVDDHVTLFTSLVVREDSLTLFGFPSPENVEIFEVLLSVSGVGPRSALAILSTMEPAEILSAVVDEDDSAFKKVAGIGPKTAKLIIVQLAGKIQALSVPPAMSERSSTDAVSDTVLNALIGLGWNERSAQAAIKSVLEGSETHDSASLLKSALTLLAGK